jgi:hypothetical protein
MKWVLFLVFSGTSHTPLAEYKEFKDCINVSDSLTAAAQKVNPPNQAIIKGIMSGYICLPVPK